MHRPNKGLIVATAGLALAVSLVALSPAAPALAQGAKTAFVQVVNNADSPVPIFDVQHPRCTPFQNEFVLGPSSGQAFETVSFVVARDKRLVIEHVSVDAAGDGFIRTRVNTTVGGIEVEHFLVSVPQGTTESGAAVFRTSQPTRWYADPATEVEITSGMTPPNGGNTLVSISRWSASRAA
jgi:hypothetical protein